MELSECPSCLFIVEAHKIKVDLLKYDFGTESICHNCSTAFTTYVKEYTCHRIITQITMSHHDFTTAALRSQSQSQMRLRKAADVVSNKLVKK